ncbi:MAG: hypothetical protein IKZ62_11340 [Prevotella sp.]|nr:hypothetical protein [Prevotella sp.]
MTQIQEEGSKKPSKDDSNQRRIMKDDGDGSIQTGHCAIGHTGIAVDTGHQPMQLIRP